MYFSSKIKYILYVRNNYGKDHRGAAGDRIFAHWLIITSSTVKGGWWWVPVFTVPTATTLPTTTTSCFSQFI